VFGERRQEEVVPVIRPRYSKEEFARRGDEIYERDIVSHLGPDDEGKFVVIDIETGAYEIDWDEVAASDRLLAHYPDAQVWLRRVGSRYAHRFGSRNKAVER
jgi:hypothetical protein